MRLQLPEWPWQIVRQLAVQKGAQVWVVGGAVRDMLMGLPVHDWDYVTDRDALTLARQVATALGGGYFTLDVERGIGRVLLSTQGRKRTVLDFALLQLPTLEADLSQRDFTINALAVDAEGYLIDPLGGRFDIENRVLRTTHPQAFMTDPVRLLRAVRLAVQLSFAIAPETETLMCRDAPLLARTSPERVRDEVVRMLELANAAHSFQQLSTYGLLEPIMPDLSRTQGVTQSWPHHLDVWGHTLTVVRAVEELLYLLGIAQWEVPPRSPGVPPAIWGDVQRALGQFAEDLIEHLNHPIGGSCDRTVLLKLGALLHDIGKPETRSEDAQGHVHFYGHEQVGAQKAREQLQRLRFSRNESEWVARLVEGHMRLMHLSEARPVTRRAIYRYFRDLGDAGVETILLGLADHLAVWGAMLDERHWAARLETAELLLTHYFEHYTQTIAPEPLVSGHDLMERLGLPPGPSIGKLLAELRERQAAGEIRTPEEALVLAEQLYADRSRADAHRNGE